MTKRYIKYKSGRVGLTLAIKRAFDNILEDKPTDAIISSRGEDLIDIQYANSGVIERGQIKINKKTVRVESSDKFFILLKKEISKIKEGESEDTVLEKLGNNSFQRNG
tara:strand:- start:230 stop:553 length:324 start_codon:yes stop_codon:yes gene_type:complete